MECYFVQDAIKEGVIALSHLQTSPQLADKYPKEELDSAIDKSAQYAQLWHKRLAHIS